MPPHPARIRGASDIRGFGLWLRYRGGNQANGGTKADRVDLGDPEGVGMDCENCGQKMSWWPSIAPDDTESFRCENCGNEFELAPDLDDED